MQSVSLFCFNTDLSNQVTLRKNYKEREYFYQKDSEEMLSELETSNSGL